MTANSANQALSQMKNLRMKILLKKIVEYWNYRNIELIGKKVQNYGDRIEFKCYKSYWCKKKKYI